MTKIQELYDEIMNQIYPVGSIYISTNNTNPKNLFGGYWVQIKDTFLLGAGNTYSNGSTGGSADAVTISHNHGFTYGGNAICLYTNTAETTSGFGSSSNFFATQYYGNKGISNIASAGESGTGKNMPPYMAVYVWKRLPALYVQPTNGTIQYTSAYPSTMSQSNGELIGKGFTIQPGWSNEGLWEAKFEFKHDNIRYTGIIFLCNADTYTTPTSDGNNDVLKTWEGTWTGGDRYANYNSGTIDWFDVTVTKIDSTHVRLQSTTLNRDTTVEVSWLPSASRLTCGAVHNSASNEFGPCRIRNLVVTSI